MLPDPVRVARSFAGLLVGLGLTAMALAQKPKEAWEYLQEPAFKRAYTKALGPKARTAWLARRDGPAPQDRFIGVAGTRYVMNSFCKNHDCNGNSAVLLYAPGTDRVYGTIHEKGRTTLIGDPPPPVAAELGRLWTKEWRSAPQ